MTSEQHATPAAISAMAIETMKATQKALEKALVGKMVRVTSDHNGQPYGRSRKSWRAEVARIKYIRVDLDGQCPLQLCLEGHEFECFIPADKVEFT